MPARDTPIDARVDPVDPAMIDLADSLTISEYSEAVERAGERLISVIVPASNDRMYLPACFNHIEEGLRGTEYTYEIIVVDDNSLDGTADYVRSLEGTKPIRLVEKRGGRGRALSIKEGIDQSLGGIIVLLDADINFPPATLRAMLEKLKNAHVVVAARVTYPSMAYAAFSRWYSWLFGRVLLSVKADVRSGLKMFRRSLLDPLRFDPEFDPRLGFDAVLLYLANRVGWTTVSLPVHYTRPAFRHGMMEAVTSRIALAAGIVSLKIVHVVRMIFPFMFPPEPREYFEAGFTNVNDYLFLTTAQSAKAHVTRETVSLTFFTVALAVASLYAGSSLLHVSKLVLIAAGISTLYLVLMAFKLYMLVLSLKRTMPPATAEELASLTHDELPVISVLIPLYKEPDIIPQIFRYLSDFDYPADKLDIIFILESTDTQTAQAFLDMHPPSHFKALLSPDVQPKTKPKAMNVAFGAAKGDVLVIFDAEVLPERDQLKRAVYAFKQHPEAMYLHSKMDVYNTNENWITRLYTAEFCFFYHYFMPGLVSSKFPIPISGHSTYFRRTVIEKVGAWDAYNVAEDCDIGIRIYRKGFGSGMMLESHTWEQSTTTIPTWVRQRTRWIQGFIQTSMVQLRYPFLLKRELKTWRNFLVFFVLVPGNVLLNILNIIQWIMFVIWHTTHAPFLQVAYTGVTLYLATTCFVAGNFLFTFFAMLSLYERKHYTTVPWGAIMFVYWIMLGIATIRATIHLFLHPHKWDKTAHVAAKAV